jgi:hypothetical protein
LAAAHESPGRVVPDGSVKWGFEELFGLHGVNVDDR